MINDFKKEKWLKLLNYNFIHLNKKNKNDNNFYLNNSIQKELTKLEINLKINRQYLKIIQ